MVKGTDIIAGNADISHRTIQDGKKHGAKESKTRKPDQRRARTRAALLDAAKTILSARPAEAISVEDITEAAKVAKGSFYNHFADKNAITEEVFTLVSKQAVADQKNYLDGEWTPAEKIARGSFAIIRFALEHPESAGVIHRLSPSSILPDTPLNAKLVDVLRLGMADRSFRRIPIESAMLLVMGVVVIAQEKILTTGPNLNTVANMAAMVEAVLIGLGVVPEIAEQAAEQASSEVLAGLEFRLA